MFLALRLPLTSGLGEPEYVHSSLSGPREEEQALGLPQNITSFSVVRTPSPRKGKTKTLTRSIFSTSGQANTISGWLFSLP
jgi:hypothetical protein